MKRAVFLDRDGTVIEEVGYLNRLDRVVFFPWSVDAIRVLNDAGLLDVIVTNQAGVARGYLVYQLTDSKALLGTMAFVSTIPVLLLGPVAGIVVPGSQSGVALSAMTRIHLKPGGAYLWRVLGVGKDGVVLGESPWREIRVP